MAIKGTIIQAKLLLADWCLAIALKLAGNHWSTMTLVRFGELAKSIRADMILGQHNGN